MSWSINLIGTPANIEKELINYSSQITGDAKKEYDEAMPSICALVNLNFGPYNSLLELIASGHAYAALGGTSSNFSISLKPTPSKLV